MKNNGKVRVSIRKDMGVLFSLCILCAGLVLPYLINGWMIEFWGFPFCAFVIASALCLWGMRVGLTIDTENRVIIRKTFFKTTKIAFGNIKSVKIKNVFLGKEITIIGDDGKVFDKTRSVLFKENYIIPENFVAYFSSGCNDRDLLNPSKKLEKEVAMNSKVPLAILAVIQLVLLVLMAILRTPEYPIAAIKFYDYGYFWAIAGISVATLIGLLVKNRYVGVTDFIGLLLFFGFIPVMFFADFGSNEDYYVSYTNDFANYNEIIAEQWEGDDNYFPTEINGEVCDFSYYHKFFWDYITEIYVEVQYDDEEYARISNEYEERESSYFGAQYEEINFSKECFYVDEDSDGELYISHAWIEKIIFDEENNVVIYYYLSVTDPFEAEWCHLATKFNIDLEEYQRYIKEKSESVKDA